MKVRATRLGYYGIVRRRPGDVFELVEVKGVKLNKATGKHVPHTFTVEEQFSSAWMEPEDPEAVVGKAKAKPEFREPVSLSKAQKNQQ